MSGIGPRQHKLCAFCNGDATAYNGRLGRMEGPYNASKNGYEAVYVHHECAVWSPNTSQDEQMRLRSVGTEVRRARNLRCSSCNNTGAAIGCRVPSCSKCYHLPCAIEQGCRFNFELYLMSCPDHAALFNKEPTGQAKDRIGGPLGHLKLAGSRHRHSILTAVHAAAGGTRTGHKMSKVRKRNTMTAAQLGDHIDAAKAAFQTLAAELAAHDDSEPDEAVIMRTDAKRLRKATQQLAPTLLHAPPGQQQQQQRQLIMQEQQLMQQWRPPAGGLASIGGLADVKRQLKEMVLLPLAHPQIMQQLGIQLPRGILLHGPPGTGKTAIVRALAAECAAVAGWGNATEGKPKPVALFARKGTDCLGKYAGDAELHLRVLFDMAAAAAPSIIFLDELDGLVPPRSVRSSSSDQIFASVVSVMLALMDGLKDRGQVLIIGATNRPDAIDPALRRPGRFDREVYFNLPPQQDRQEILTVHTACWTPQPSPELLRSLAAATDGWAGADLQSLVAGALFAAVRRSTPHLLSTHDSSQQQQQQRRWPGQGNQLLHHQLQQEQQQQRQPQQRGDGAVDGGQAPPGDASTPVPGSPTGAHSMAEGVSGQKQPAGEATHHTDQADHTVPATGSVDVVEAQSAEAARSGGFLAALTSYVAEQQQQQPSQAWLKPIDPGLLSPPRASAKAKLVDADNNTAAAVALEAAQPGGSASAAADAEMQLNASGPSHLQPSPEHSLHNTATTAVQQHGCQLAGATAAVTLRASLPEVEVSPCDWAAALAAAGPPASKREMSSLASLNPAAPLPAPLLPLLLPALARVVLLLHRWLMLGPHSDELAAAALRDRPDTTSLAAQSDAGFAAGQTSDFGDLLVQFGAVERGRGCIASLVNGNHAAAAADLSGQEGSLTSSSSSAPSRLFTNQTGCRCLLLSGHGASGQPEAAAAVLALLCGASAAAVHTLSLPGMLLAGDGDAGSGLALGVKEALGRVGRGQLLVLYMPRIELWALHATTKAAERHAQPTRQQQDAAAQPRSSVWTRSKPALGGAGAMCGVMSSSSSSDDSGMDSDSDGEHATGDLCHTDLHCNEQQLDPNNAWNRAQSHLPMQARHVRCCVGQQQRRPQRPSKQKQQQQQWRLSAAWSVFEQQLAVLPSDQSVLLLATSHVPVEALPAELQQVFGGKDWQQCDHGMGEPRSAGAIDHSSSVVQVCCCNSMNAVTASSEARAALSCALDRAVNEALAHCCCQLATKTGSKSTSEAGAAVQATDVSKAQILQQNQSVTDNIIHVDKQQQMEERKQCHTGPIVAAASQQRALQQEQQQQSQVVSMPLLQQLNDAQQDQARHLFDQVQQHIRLIAGLVLQDPRIRMAKLQHQHRHSSRPASAEEQAMLVKVQQALPLAAVCMKAMRGWFCSLDQFQAEFAAAANRVRGADSHNRCIAATYALEDVVGVACFEAAQQLRLYEPERLRLFNAAATAKEARIGEQRQQLLPQQHAHTMQQQQVQHTHVGGAICMQQQEECGNSRGVPTAGATETFIMRAREDQQCEEVHQEQLLHSIQGKLQALAARQLLEWDRRQRDLQQQQQQTVREGGCWASLHSTLQRFCRLAASQVYLLQGGS